MTLLQFTKLEIQKTMKNLSQTVANTSILTRKDYPNHFAPNNQ